MPVRERGLRLALHVGSLRELDHGTRLEGAPACEDRRRIADTTTDDGACVKAATTALVTPALMNTS